MKKSAKRPTEGWDVFSHLLRGLVRCSMRRYLGLRSCLASPQAKFRRPLRGLLGARGVFRLPAILVPFRGLPHTTGSAGGF